jgi:uroporphyrinogen-III decarboxylase
MSLPDDHPSRPQCRRFVGALAAARPAASSFQQLIDTLVEASAAYLIAQLQAGADVVDA